MTTGTCITKFNAYNEIHALNIYITTFESFLGSLPHLFVQFDPDSEVPTLQWEEHDIFYPQKEKNTPKFNYKNM